LNHSQIITIFKYIKIYPSQSGTGCQEILSTIEHTALSSLAGTAGAAWVAGICWPGINNLDHLKLIKTFKTWQFHAISGIVGKIQMSILGGEGCRYCAPRHSLGPSHDISYIFIHDHTCASHIQPSQTIRNYQNHQKILQTFTNHHSNSQYPNISQYNSIHRNISHAGHKKKSKHTALSSSAGPFPGTAGTAGAAWGAMGCWLLLAKHTWCLVNLDHPKISKTCKNMAIP
jgi:hypothetical protein